MIGRLAGLSLDARFAMPSGDPASRAIAARWIAANALAIRGVRVAVEGVTPRGASLFGLRTTTFAATIAAIAAVPVLIDAATLPRHWRVLLRVLGIPTLDSTSAAAIGLGASVLACDAVAAPCELAVESGWEGFRVRIEATHRMLVA